MSFSSSHGSEESDVSCNEVNEKWKYWTVIGIVFIAIVVGALIKGSKVTTNESYESYIKSVRSVIKNEFPTISKENRDLLRLIGQKIYLEPENHAPLVVLVGGTPAKQIAEAVNRAVQDAKSDEHTTAGKSSIRVESDTDRAELHANLQEILGPALISQSSPRTAVILDVDLLKWDAVLVLHAFSDHGKYPVPKTILFLTVSSQQDSTMDIANTSCDEKMVQFLTKRWIENGGSSDNIPPIIARISYFLCV